MDHEQLALEGGTPVRRSPFAYQCIGANLIGAEEERLVLEVLRSQTLFRHYGPRAPHMVDDLEREVCTYLGVRYALATATGSGAYFCALAALGLGPGDEVIIPTYGWITDYSAVTLTGATPVFADIDESFNLNPEAFAAKISARTRAVIVIHYQGAASRLDEIISIAKAHQIKVVEDVAQACGGTYAGRKLGSWGDIGCFSLQTHKMITSGDGGIVATDDQELYERAVRYHDLGLLRETFVRRLESPVITKPLCGLQWRMNELSGAVALAQLRKLPGMLTRTKAGADVVRGEISRQIPEIKFRAVRAEDETGITLLFNLGSAENVSFFKQAYEAEGFVYGPTSYCQSMGNIDVVRSCLEQADAYRPEEFTKTEQLEKRFAAIAVLPVYSDQDIQDISRGLVKVLRVMKQRGMI
jgi:8-amino-3,8-dideoxy-alpha-D-manno-octulosonate transaminase